MNGKTVRISRGGPSGVIALVAALMLAPGGADQASAAKKEGMVDYSAPVRVRVKKPATADQIDPNAMQISDDEMAGGYDGKQMEVAPQRTVSVPSRVWRQGDLDELPPPAWEDCKKTKPRFRPLEGPHGRFSAGVIYREFGDVEFSSRSMLTEDLSDEAHYLNLGGGSVVIKPGGVFDVDEGEYWHEDVDAGGPYIAFDLLFPISSYFKLGQQVSFSYSRASAADHFSNLEGSLTDDVTAISGRAEAYMRNKVVERLDVDVYTLSLGPIAEFNVGPVFLQGSGGLAINMVQFNADVSEKLYIDSNFDDDVFLEALKDSGPAYLRHLEEDEEVLAEKWEDGNHGTKFLFGWYLQGLLGVQISQSWSVAGFGRYDWNDSLEGEVGYSRFGMDLSAFSAGAQVGYSF